MADVNTAIDFVLRQEDRALSGVCTNSPADRGGLTRFGIASKWHPDLLRSGFYQAPREEALDTARLVYAKEYASFLSLDRIREQAIANALLSFAILENAGRAATEMQESLNIMGCRLVVDGSIGPLTLKAINAQDGAALLSRYVAQNADFLQGLVNKDPSQQKWIKGWMNRCMAVAAQTTSGRLQWTT